jgi:lysine 6-dehydrogenase
MRMLVLGAGLQGSACAFDLLRNPAVERVVLADVRIGALPAFLQPYAGSRLVTTELDVRNHDAVRALMRECTAVCSAIPYYFNFPLAQLAVECGVHFTDLGGNTEIVLQQKGLEADAEAKGVSVVPDTGLAPGMVNILAQYGISQLDTTSMVKLYVGGLPQNPEPPLNYQIVYSLEGVVDYYTTESLVVRDGRRATMRALSEVEQVQFPEPVGTLEAFHTAGGLSTMAFRYDGKIPNMEYKTLRYPGHARIMEAIRDLGLLSLDPVDVKGQSVVPRDVFVKVAGEKLRKPGGKDLVALRVVVTGTKDGAPAERAWQMVARYDEKNGLTAMMQTTGFTLSITSQMQATGVIRPGVHTPDECVPADKYLEMLAERGVMVEAMQ